jgi:hypothetical protein
MSGDYWEELIAAARSRLVEQEAEEQEASAELGESVDLAEKEVFTGRVRGYGKTWAKRDGERVQVEVPLFWDTDGARRFMWPKTRLQWELDALRPDVGDEIVIIRGADIPSSSPAFSPTQRFAVRVRPCDKPLPDEPAGDDGIPF